MVGEVNVLFVSVCVADTPTTSSPLIPELNWDKVVVNVLLERFITLFVNV